jgi:hypothetical protein
MADVSFPILVLTDRTRFDELSELFANSARQLAAQKLPNAILLYEIADAPEWAHASIKPPAVPDRMLVMAFQAAGRDVVARAVDRVGERIPDAPAKPKFSLNVKANTPLRNFFRQLEEVGLVRFRMNHTSAPNSALFFLRTAAAVQVFKEELPRAFATVSPPPAAENKAAS